MKQSSQSNYQFQVVSASVLGHQAFRFRFLDLEIKGVRVVLNSRSSACPRSPIYNDSDPFDRLSCRNLSGQPT